MPRKTLLGGTFWLYCAALFSRSAFATIQMDLRFPDGSHSKLVAAGTYTVEVWAQVHGTNTTGTDDALLQVFGSIQSQQINGGAIVSGSSGVTGNIGFGPAFNTVPSLGQPGTPQDLTIDGVQDWGTTTSNNLNTIKYVSSAFPPLAFGAPGIVANLLDEGAASAGVEFKVGLVAVSVNLPDISGSDLSTTQTVFNWIKATGIAPAPYAVFLDGASTSVFSAASYLTSVSPDNSVTFYAPEPNSAALVCVTTLIVFQGRTRRKAQTSPPVAVDFDELRRVAESSQRSPS